MLDASQRDPMPFSQEQRGALTSLRLVLQDLLLATHNEKIGTDLFDALREIYPKLSAVTHDHPFIVDLTNQLASLTVTDPMVLKGRRALQNTVIDRVSKLIGRITMELRFNNQVSEVS
jgi:hypothetical protein